MSQKLNLDTAWKRPVSRLYHYNLDVGENYYNPMTAYLDEKYSTSMKVETPGPLSFRFHLLPNRLLFHNHKFAFPLI
jgi:hypothetical protein